LANEETLAIKRAEDSIINMIPMDVREMSHAGEQSSLLQDLQMRTDQKDIRLKEPSEMEIKGVMD